MKRITIAAIATVISGIIGFTGIVSGTDQYIAKVSFMIFATITWLLWLGDRNNSNETP